MAVPLDTVVDPIVVLSTVDVVSVGVVVVLCPVVVVLCAVVVVLCAAVVVVCLVVVVPCVVVVILCSAVVVCGPVVEDAVVEEGLVCPVTPVGAVVLVLVGDGVSVTPVPGK